MGDHTSTTWFNDLNDLSLMIGPSGYIALILVATAPPIECP